MNYLAASSEVSLKARVTLRRKRRGIRPEGIQCLEHLLDLPEVIIEDHMAVTSALSRFSKFNADFADCLIERLGHAAGCKETVTFDVNASKFAGMRLL
jgi:predicted nucleic-acid-binding protein